MTKTRAFWIAMIITMAGAPLAVAKTSIDETRPVQAVSPLPKATLVADNVVVAPNQPGPAQPAQPTVVQPAPVAQPVAPVAVEPSRSHHSEVHADVSPPRNYVGTIAVSALMGGVAGALIGGAIYFLDNQNHPYNIAYWAAGGVLVGTGIGVAQIVVQENRASQAVALNRLPSDPAPTARVSLFKAQF